MRIILPPSETKRSGGGSVFAPSQLSFHAELQHTRAVIRAELERLSLDEGAAIQALKLGVKSRSERLHNLELATSGALPAIDRYTGVLYDALDSLSLAPDARAWLESHVFVQSALFGVISAADLIPAYRLSASSRLGGLGGPLPKLWRDAHSEFSWHNGEWVLDLRSQDYVALAPIDESTSSYLHVVEQGEDGVVRALNHFNKAAKGELVRKLALSNVQIHNAEELCAWGERSGIKLVQDGKSTAITLILNPSAS